VQSVKSVRILRQTISVVHYRNTKHHHLTLPLSEFMFLQKWYVFCHKQL